MPGNQGGSNWGSTAANPADGSVYVIGFNVPTLIRLLKPGEMRPGRGGGAAGSGEGRTLRRPNGFGLYPNIANPPYTTLTAYDLNRGTIKWQIGLGDDLRLVGAGHQGHRHGGDDQGRDHRHRHRPGVRHRRGPQGPCLRQRDRQADVGTSAWAARRGRAVDVRARRPAVPARDRVRIPGRGAPAPAGPTGIIAYALPRN